MIEIDDNISDGDGVYQYCTKSNKRSFKPYSGRFETPGLAEAWYNTKGKWLEETFGRKLYLIKDSNEEWSQ